MKVNDIVLCNVGLAKISNIDNDTVTVVYDFIHSKTYKIEDAVFLKNNAVEKIIQIHNVNNLKQYELDSNTRKRLHHLNLLDINISEEYLNFSILYDFNKEKLSINLTSNKIYSDIHGHEYSKGAINLLNYLYQIINCLQKFDVTQEINNGRLLKLVQDFSKSCFDLTILNKIKAIMKQKSLAELAAFFQALDEMEIYNTIKEIMFFLLQDTTYSAFRIYDIMASKTNFVREIGYTMLTGVAYRSIEYVTYKHLSNNEVVQWINDMDRMYRLDDLLDKNSYYGQLFLQYIQNEEMAIEITKNYTRIYSPFFSFSSFKKYLFENIPLTTQKKLIELELIDYIPLDYAKKIDVETFLECYKLLKSDDLLPAIQSHYDEIIKINPKIILDMLITPYTSISEQRYNLLTQAAELLPDVKFLKSFIKHGYNHNFTCSFKKEIGKDEDDFDAEDENEYHDGYDYF